MTNEIDYKNFSKVADLAVERITWTTAESLKFCETETIYRYLFYRYLPIRITL